MLLYASLSFCASLTYHQHNCEFLVRNRLPFIVRGINAKPLMERPIKRTSNYANVTVL